TRPRLLGSNRGWSEGGQISAAVDERAMDRNCNLHRRISQDATRIDRSEIAEIQKEKSSENRIVVCDEPSELHPLVRRTLVLTTWTGLANAGSGCCEMSDTATTAQLMCGCKCDQRVMVVSLAHTNQPCQQKWYYLVRLEGSRSQH